MQYNIAMLLIAKNVTVLYFSEALRNTHQCFCNYISIENRDMKVSSEARVFTLTLAVLIRR